MSLSPDHISHIGIVTNCDEKKAIVQLLDSEECDSCTLKGICGVDDDRSRFEVPQQGLHVGDQVSLELSASAGLEAMFWAYGLPFLLMIAVIIGGAYAGVEEKWIGILSLFILIPYYLILSVFKKILKSHMDLNIIKHE